jgi:3-hydroxyisobutyryl-CoA hydrolase
MVNSIFHKLIEKKKETPTWVPASLDDPSLDEKQLLTTWFDRSKSDVLAKAPRMYEVEESGKRDQSAWGQYRAWGIPSEDVVKSYVTGSAKGSGAFALTEEQLKQRIVRHTADRFQLDPKVQVEWAEGIRERVRDVVERCCEVEEGHEEKYLRWKSHAKAKL